MKPIHLTPKAKISENKTRAFPLLEPQAPKYDGTPKSIGKIIDFLDVEKSARYSPNATQTFCNIYAYDYAYLMGAYVPRVFWNSAALKRVKEGEDMKPVYNSTIVEMNANALYDWFKNESKAFGWKEVTEFTEAQNYANAGKCVIAVAANVDRSRSGHIVAIVPEGGVNKAMRAQGLSSVSKVLYPLQSQAGRRNRKYFAEKWWGGHEPVRVYVFV